MIAYACSGCSSAGQMANWIAVQLDRRGIAEMSCISGIGGNVPALLTRARKAREIIAIDGCPLQCARHCLEARGIAWHRHYELSRMGVRKSANDDFDGPEAERLLLQIADDLRSDPCPRATLEGKT